MEELKYLTPEQDDIINRFIRENYLRDNFYFTGGTALSSCYLQHRYSDDLDFFTSGTFNNLAILYDWTSTDISTNLCLTLI